jgi:hypothetical protein
LKRIIYQIFVGIFYTSDVEGVSFCAEVTEIAHLLRLVQLLLNCTWDERDPGAEPIRLIPATEFAGVRRAGRMTVGFLSPDIVFLEGKI